MTELVMCVVGASAALGAVAIVVAQLIGIDNFMLFWFLGTVAGIVGILTGEALWRRLPDANT